MSGKKRASSRVRAGIVFAWILAMMALLLLADWIAYDARLGLISE